MFQLKFIKILHFLKGHVWYNSRENKIFSFVIVKNHLIQFIIICNDSVYQKNEIMINKPNVYTVIQGRVLPFLCLLPLLIIVAPLILNFSLSTTHSIHPKHVLKTLLNQNTFH